jgi:Phospholipase_D-nuclease N-terminal
MIFEAEGIVALLLFAFWIWALLDCIATDAALCRNLPKGMWLILVLFLPDLGSLAWLLLGRPEKAHWRPGSTDYSARRRPIGLEDQPRYGAITGASEERSAELDRELERWEEQRRAAIESGPKVPADDASDLDPPNADPPNADPPNADPPNADPPRSDAPDLDAWEADLDRREADIRRRQLEQRQRELDEQDRKLGDA